MHRRLQSGSARGEEWVATLRQTIRVAAKDSDFRAERKGAPAYLVAPTHLCMAAATLKGLPLDSSLDVATSCEAICSRLSRLESTVD